VGRGWNTFQPVLWLGAQTDVGIKADIQVEAAASFSVQTSVTVKTKMEATMVTMKKLIAGLLVGSMLLWGLVTFLQRRGGC
jgi:hypothetical protein